MNQIEHIIGVELWASDIVEEGSALCCGAHHFAIAKYCYKCGDSLTFPKYNDLGKALGLVESRKKWFDQLVELVRPPYVAVITKAARGQECVFVGVPCEPDTNPSPSRGLSTFRLYDDLQAARSCFQEGVYGRLLSDAQIEMYSRVTRRIT